MTDVRKCTVGQLVREYQYKMYLINDYLILCAEDQVSSELSSGEYRQNLERINRMADIHNEIIRRMHLNPADYVAMIGGNDVH